MPSVILPACARKHKFGPEAGAARFSTRLARVYRVMARSRPLKAIPLDCRALARQMRCSYQTVVRLTGSFASGGPRTVWGFQGYGFVIFLRYRPHRKAPSGHPQFYVINRHGLHRIGGEPGRVRARLRQKKPAQWLAYLDLIEKLAWGQIIRARERANDKHNGFPSRGTGGPREARGPPTEKVPPVGGIKIAQVLQGRFDALPGAPRVSLVPWCDLRLKEWHDRERIFEALRHAVSVMPEGRFAPVNPAAWVCAVASRHLDRDGLGVIQRFRDQQKGRVRKQAAPAATSNELMKTDFVDSDGKKWQHLGGTNWREIS